jgi:hypothetical protein
MIAILNSSILTTFGSYTYTDLSLADAKKLLKDGFESYVAHEATNMVIGKLFDIDLPHKREMYFQETGEKAIVFKLNKRLTEGQVLTTKEEIEQTGYTIGLLTKN